MSKREQAIRIVRLVNDVFPNDNFKHWNRCQHYLGRAKICADLISRFEILTQEAAELLHRLGSYCYTQAQYSDAERYLYLSLQICERRDGPENIETARTLNVLGLVLLATYNYQKAESVQKRALALLEQILGPDHTDTAAVLCNLALLYTEHGKQDCAEVFSK